jgi:hypothetical protein
MRDQIEAAISILQDVLKELDQSEPQLPADAKALMDQGRCLNCKKPLGDDDHLRGVHRKCFQRIRRNIRDGLLSENQAIQTGILAPKKLAGRRQITDDQLSQVLDSKPPAPVAFDQTAPADIAKKYRKKKPPQE